MSNSAFPGYRQVNVTGRRAEASSLLDCRNPAVLDAFGFDQGYWVALDEGPVETALLLLGHKADRPVDRGWKARRLDLKASKNVGRTDDSESLGRFGGHVYVFGSHFGGKGGPLDAPRAFVARFDETALDGKCTGVRLPLEVVQRPFALHRCINDALRDAQVDLIPLGTHVRERFIERTLRKGYKRGAAWSGDVRVEDWPLNVEGAWFDTDGSAVLGLRFPTTAHGQPLLVRVAGIVESFTDPGAPLRALSVSWLADVGERSVPTGVRDVDSNGDGLHVLVGPIGSVYQPNAVAMDYPGSEKSACRHYRVSNGSDSGPLSATRVSDLGDYGVEGLAPMPGGGWIYAHDSKDALEIAVPEA